MTKCAEVVVTYNRKALLQENLTALLGQTFDDHDILVIDNASTDGTREMVQSMADPRIKYHNTGKNLGGAGGFAYGMRVALEDGYRYAWLMDDDSVPEPDALESLVRKAEMLGDGFSFLASLVCWTDGNLFPMNFPRLDHEQVIHTPTKYAKEQHLLPIGVSSFVGCFVDLKVARKVGLPIADFFIYADDVEYTHRLRREKPAYLDMDSLIVHKAPSNIGADIAKADVKRIDRFYYQSRNGMYDARKSKAVLKRFWVVAKRYGAILRHAPDHKLKRMWVLTKGTVAGLFYSPKIEYVDPH